MHIEQIRDYALSLIDVEESCPFGPSVVVFKTNSKIFLLLPLDTEDVRFNVKCDPEQAILQRQEYPDCILPGYHMNKTHWNTIIVDGRLSNSQLKNFISDSHVLINSTKSKRKG